MREAYIIDAVRTPMGRYGGALSRVRPDDLAALVIAALIERTQIDPGVVEDVVFGCANQAGEDNRNVARMALLLAGLPVEVGGTTINRLCGSSLDAVQYAARAIQVGEGEVFIAGGVESMTRAPYAMPKPEYAFERGHRTLYDTTLGWRFPNPKLKAKFPLEEMGETAENIFDITEVSREEQDRFALESHRRAVAATREGRFKNEMVPVPVPGKNGQVTWVEIDETPRPDTSLGKMAALQPAFRRNGTVTAGNSSPLSDGAAALLLTSREAAHNLGLSASMRIVASAVAGVDPRTMGYGPVPAVRKVLQRAGLTLDQIDLVELNEAFAVQAIAVMRELGLDLARTNVNGGAVALGHPLGCSGARILTTLVHEMRRRQARYGLATLCIGVGQGIATIVERVE
ncbi:MAG: acetyl-CoA C-acyltransferase [Chloroflexi bacterium]|nr:acetyl-CoA C-acyltransferase [Chloroflexota bacterium]